MDESEFQRRECLPGDLLFGGSLWKFVLFLKFPFFFFGADASKVGSSAKAFGQNAQILVLQFAVADVDENGFDVGDELRPVFDGVRRRNAGKVAEPVFGVGKLGPKIVGSGFAVFVHKVVGVDFFSVRAGKGDNLWNNALWQNDFDGASCRRAPSLVPIEDQIGGLGVARKDFGVLFGKGCS